MTKRDRAIGFPTLPAVAGYDNFDEWQDAGRQLSEFGGLLKRTGAQYQIFVGHWYNEGLEKEARWRKDNLASRSRRAISIERAANELGFDKETLANWAWVERNTAKVRGALNGSGKDLTFEDLRSVAAIESPRAQREWIDRKQKAGWSGSELRRQIAQAKGKPASPRGDAEREQAEQDAVAALVERWTVDGKKLMAKGDSLSRAQADVYMDCAAKLRNALKRPTSK